MLWEHGVAGSNPVNPTRMGISLPMDLTRAGGCPGSTTGSAGRRNQHIRDHWQEGSKSVGERRHPSPIRRASPGRSLGSQPSSFGRRTTRHRRATYPKKHGNADVVQWQHACFPSRRSRVRTPSSALSGENQNNGSNPIMGLVTVFPWDVSGETWTNSLGMGAHRLGRKHASRLGSSEEEQVPFKHWVRIS